MEYNDWYERYQKYQAQQNPQPKKKKGVSIAALVAAVLVAALVAGVAGGFVTSAYLGKTQASALPEQQQAALPENSDPQPEKKPSVLTEAPASSQGSSLLQNGTGAGYTKAQIVEIAAPSVVGIDVTIPNTNSGYNFGWGHRHRQSLGRAARNGDRRHDQRIEPRGQRAGNRNGAASA